MRNHYIVILIALAFAGCSSPGNTPENGPAASRRSQAQHETPDCNIALKFINEYTVHCASPGADSEWVQHCPLLSEHFKNSYNKILADASKADPELGLDADPIFDAQDFPDKGFELVSCDSATGYVTLRGKDWPDFLLVLRVAQENNKWLVDGAGIINIPEKQRAKR